MIDNKIIITPFNKHQVHMLNVWQKRGNFHPFTCGNNSNHEPLIATTDGWICLECNYTQNWAHEFMTYQI